MVDFKPGDRVQMVPPTGKCLEEHPDVRPHHLKLLKGALTIRDFFESKGGLALTFEELNPESVHGAGAGPDGYWRFYIRTVGHTWFKHIVISTKEDMEALYG